MITRPPVRPLSCRGHAWQLTGRAAADDGDHTQYECVLCERILWVPPGGATPAIYRESARSER